MREIKFRAYDKEIKCFIPIMEFIEDFKNAKFRNLGNEIVTKESNICNLQVLLTHKEIEITQHTGYKDKNGVDIYEGDILKTEDFYKHGELIFKGEIFKVENLDYYLKSSTCLDTKCAEVIGNIYENPELLPIKSKK